MTQYIIDIETNGITDWAKLSDLKEVFVLSIFNRTEGTMHSFNNQGGGNIQEGIEMLNGADEIIGHNIVNFDIPALFKLYGFGHPNLTDTVILSRCIYPDLKNR